MAAVATRPAVKCAAFVAVAGLWRLPVRGAAVATGCVFVLVFVLAVVAQAFGGRTEPGADLGLSAGCAVAGLLGAVAFFVGIYFLVAP
jgi:hypothetical protein